MSDAVLDFDLDYFTYPPVHYPFWASWLPSRRKPDAQREAWNRKYRFWMTRGTLVSRMRELGVPPLPHRRKFEDHQQVLPFWIDLVHSGQLTIPFTVYHFDAHSDLFLSKAEESDAHFERIARLYEHQGALPELIHEANYLWWAVYMGLTDRIVWIIPEPQFRRDLQIDLEGPFFHAAPNRAAERRLDRAANQARTGAAIARMLGQKEKARKQERDADHLQEAAVAARYEQPVVLRRFGMEVPVTLTTLSRLEAISNPKALSICRSPDYTPAKADRFFETFFTLFD